MVHRHFTLDQANALVPKFEASMQRALQLHAMLSQKARELADAGCTLDHSILTGGKPVPTPEGAQTAMDQARMIYEAIVEEVGATHALGGEVKSIAQGLVDVRSYLDGETEVLLCWKLGERRIAHFHALDTGFDERKPIIGHLFDSKPRHPESQREPP